MGLREVFDTVSDFFEREKMDYAVIGGFALFGFGYIRATQDIDFITRIEYQKKILVFFENLGFETAHCSSAFSNHIHPIGALRVDIMYVGGVTADEIFSAIQKRIIFNHKEYPVVSPEHLIAMKLFAASKEPDRKFKDLADIKEIMKKAEVDKKKIKKLFEKYGLEGYYESITEED
jgi:hypothetical protein